MTELTHCSHCGRSLEYADELQAALDREAGLIPEGRVTIRESTDPPEEHVRIEIERM